MCAPNFRRTANMAANDSAKILVKIESLRQDAQKAEKLSKLYVRRSKTEQGMERKRYERLAEEEMAKALKAKAEVTRLKAEAKKKAKEQK
jgi:hypothetical protein